MSFSMMFDILKKKEKERIVFVKCGHFYIAIEEDAVLLHEILGLKCTCFRNNTCKVGIPAVSLNKYLSELNRMKYAYVVYDYDKLNVELKKIYNAEGKYHWLTEKNINCLECKGVYKYKDNKYLEALLKLFENK